MRGHFTQQIRKAMTQGKIFKIFKKQLNQINLKYMPVEILGTCLLFSVHWRFVVIRFLLSTNIIFYVQLILFTVNKPLFVIQKI